MSYDESPRVSEYYDMYDKLPGDLLDNEHLKEDLRTYLKGIFTIAHNLGRRPEHLRALITGLDRTKSDCLQLAKTYPTQTSPGGQNNLTVIRQMFGHARSLLSNRIAYVFQSMNLPEPAEPPDSEILLRPHEATSGNENPDELLRASDQPGADEKTDTQP